MPRTRSWRRPELVEDVWKHAATFLDVAGLGALATAGKESQKLVRAVPADVWRANLCALAPAIARAFPEKRDARNLCRAWLRRWRARDCSALVLAHRGELVPRLCVPAQIGGPVRRPSVVFAIGSGRDTRQQKTPRSTDCAGVMNWDSILPDGTEDDDASLVLIPASPTTRLYRQDEVMNIGTSCFVVDADRTMMIELWRDETFFTEFGEAPAGAYMTYRHGCIQLSRCRASDDPASVLTRMAEEGAPEGTEVMTPMGYVRFREVSPRLPLLYQITDATVSFGISEYDTQFEFDDLELMLTMALRNHPDAADQGLVSSRPPVFALE